MLFQLYLSMATESLNDENPFSQKISGEDYRGTQRFYQIIGWVQRNFVDRMIASIVSIQELPRLNVGVVRTVNNNKSLNRSFVRSFVHSFVHLLLFYIDWGLKRHSFIHLFFTAPCRPGGGGCGFPNATR